MPAACPVAEGIFTNLTLLPLLGLVIYLALHQCTMVLFRPGVAEFQGRAAFSTLGAIFLVARYLQYIDNPGVQAWAARIQFGAGMLFVVVAAVALGAVVAEKQRSFRWIYIAGIALSAGHLFGDWFMSEPLVERIDLLGRKFRTLEAGPLAWLVIPYVAVSVALLLRSGREVSKTDRARTPLLTIMPLIAAVAGTNDILMAFGVIQSVQVLEFSFAIFTMMTSYVFIRRGEELNANLEREVAARTRELRTQQDVLSKAVDTLRALVDGLPDPVFVYRHGKFLLANPSALAFLGRSESDLVDKPVASVLSPRDARAVDVIVQIESSSQPMAPTEVHFIRKDGSTAIGEVVGLAFEFRGEPAALAIVRDVTERRHIQDKLASTERLASVGTLAAGVAHEINNPLSYVLTNARLAIEAIEGKNPDLRETKEMLEEIAQGAERVRRIVGDLKDLSRADVEEIAATSVAKAVQRALNVCGNEVRHRARVDLNLGETPLVAANSARLEQVFLNLIVNASHAIPEGQSDRNTISIRSGTTDDGAAYVEIADTGSGIPKHVLDKVFDPFFTTKPFGSGTGLGLAISQNITAKFGGDIQLDSTEGEGTVARVVLPAAQGEAQSLSAIEIEPTSEIVRRVLIVDDDRTVARSLSRVLKKHHVKSASSGREALDLCKDGEFDIIFCDVMMPEMDGMQVWEELRKDVRGLHERIVFLTGGAFTRRAESFLENVPNLWLQKPVDHKVIRRLTREGPPKLDAPRHVGLTA